MEVGVASRLWLFILNFKKWGNSRFETVTLYIEQNGVTVNSHFATVTLCFWCDTHAIKTSCQNLLKLKEYLNL